MAPEMQPHRETQEQSIKARKTELFEEESRDGEGGPVRPFRAYLETTPAAPLSLGVKASLWSAGVLVGLLFVAGAAGGKTRAKVPEGLVLPVNARPSTIASIQPASALKPTVTPSKVDKPKNQPRASDDKKNQDKKAKDKKAKEKKPKDKKPKTDAVAKAGPPKPGQPNPNPDPSRPQKPENLSATTAPNPAPAPNPKTGAQARDAATRPDSAAKPGATSNAGSSTASSNSPPDQDTSKEPAKKKVSTGLFKKKPAYNPVYPKREAVKKKELLPSPGDTSSTPSTTPSP
jgi:hypothetical protein